MKRHCAPIALQRVLLAADSREQLPRGARGAAHCRSTVLLGQRNQQSCELQLFLPITEMGEQEITDFKCDRDIAFDIEVIVQICFG